MEIERGRRLQTEPLGIENGLSVSSASPVVCSLDGCEWAYSSSWASYIARRREWRRTKWLIMSQGGPVVKSWRGLVAPPSRRLSGGRVKPPPRARTPSGQPAGYPRYIGGN